MAVKSSQLLLPYTRPKSGSDVLVDYCLQKNTDIPKAIKLASNWSSLYGAEGTVADALTSAGRSASEIKWAKYVIALPQDLLAIFKETVSILSSTIYIYDKETRKDIYTRTEKLFFEKILKTAKNIIESLQGLESHFVWLQPHRQLLKGACGGVGIVANGHKTYKNVNKTVDYVTMSPEKRNAENKKGLFPKPFYLVAVLVASTAAFFLSAISLLSATIIAFSCPPVAAFSLQTVNLLGETAGFAWERSVGQVDMNKLSVSTTLYHQKEFLCKV